MSGGMCFGPASAVEHVSNKTTDAAGTWTGSVIAGLRYWVQPMTAGEFANSLVVTGSTATVTFRKFKPSGLGITLGTLLSVSAFEDNTGAVSFNLIGARDVG